MIARRPSAPLVALTGATGFLGSHVADCLLERGWRVRVSVRPTSDLRWLRGKPVEEMRVRLAAPDGPAGERARPPTAGSPAGGRAAGDGALAPPADLPTFVRGADAVLHCAGVVRAPDEAAYRRVNTETTGRLLEAAAEAGCRTFVLISSLAAGGPAPPESPLDETREPAPITAYGRSKLAAERLLERADLPLRTAVLRPPALYGPRDAAFLPLFRLALSGWLLRPGGPLRGLSLLDGRDAARAAVTLLESEHAHGVYHVDDGVAYGWADMRRILGEVVRRPLRTLTVPLWAMRAASRLLGGRLLRKVPLLERDRLADLAVAGWVCSGERLRRETGFAARWQLRSGWSDALDFYRRNAWLPKA